MTILEKVVSGELYEDDFDSISLLWDIYPSSSSDRVTEQSYGVGIKHGDGRVTMSIPTPDDNYVFQAEIEHSPKEFEDIGGIVVLSTTDNQIECQTYHHSMQGEDQDYKYVKVCADKSLFDFYASKDGESWDMIGNSSLDQANRVGFFLEGKGLPMFSDFKVKRANMYRNNKLTISEIAGNKIVSLKDSKGQELIIGNKNVRLSHEDSKIFIDLTNLILPIRGATLKVTDDDNNLVSELKDIDIHGGDSYRCIRNVEFYINGTLVNLENPFDVGRLNEENNTYKLEVKNTGATTLFKPRVRVLGYSRFYRGEGLVSIALPTELEEELAFNSYIDLPDLMPGGIREAVIKIDRDRDETAPFYAEEYRFKITLE